MVTGKQLLDAGWPAGPVIGAALQVASNLEKSKEKQNVLKILNNAWNNVDEYAGKETYAPLVKAIRNYMARQSSFVRNEPIEAPIWGRELIDQQAISQLENAMRLPVTAAGALMPDAHVGYGIPIGGVVALENAVAPYMVGVDIACRMMMSIFPKHSHIALDNEPKRRKIRTAMIEETRFGTGAAFGKYNRRQHDVLDDPAWETNRFLKHLKDKAWKQLGSSGGGNHFVDAGVLEIDVEGAKKLGLKKGSYLAIMSHSGSRGMGAQIAETYSRKAQTMSRLPQNMRHLAWLSLNTEIGQEYWLSMNLAGRYASACHHVMHRAIAKRIGLKPVKQIENHHNFAWEEEIAGKKLIVHRKGATPAHYDELGIIPGSQGHNSYIVRGLGSDLSLNSASHGAGRLMSRKKALNSIPKKERDQWLKRQGVELIGSGIDEAPQAYKDIETVLSFQTDLVEPLARFRPRMVLMAGDDKKRRRRR